MLEGYRDYYRQLVCYKVPKILFTMSMKWQSIQTLIGETCNGNVMSWKGANLNSEYTDQFFGIPFIASNCDMFYKLT